MGSAAAAAASAVVVVVTAVPLVLLTVLPRVLLLLLVLRVGAGVAAGQVRVGRLLPLAVTLALLLLLLSVGRLLLLLVLAGVAGGGRTVGRRPACTATTAEGTVCLGGVIVPAANRERTQRKQGERAAAES